MQNQQPLTDLHCHILPHVDDGAANADVSEIMLRSAAEQGISNIVFTPHYYPEDMTVDSFLENREAAYSEITELCAEYGINIKLGAEIHLSNGLSIEEIEKLRIGDTQYVLTELPGSCFPLWCEDLIFRMLDNGLIPIIAHVERYDYLKMNIASFSAWKDAGVLIQVNASSMLDRGLRRKIIKSVKKDLVHIVSSDAHDDKSRTVNLEKALKKVKGQYRTKLIENAANVFNGDKL